MSLDYYYLPARLMCGMTAAKIIDCPAGYETIQNLMVGALGRALTWHLDIATRFQGRTFEALLTFNRCRSVMAKLGMEPSDETTALYRDLRPDLQIDTVANNFCRVTYQKRLTNVP